MRSVRSAPFNVNPSQRGHHRGGSTAHHLAGVAGAKFFFYKFLHIARQKLREVITTVELKGMGEELNPLRTDFPARAEPLAQQVQRAPRALLLQVELPHGGLLAGALGLRAASDLANGLEPERVPLQLALPA